MAHCEVHLVAQLVYLIAKPLTTGDESVVEEVDVLEDLIADDQTTIEAEC